MGSNEPKSVKSYHEVVIEALIEAKGKEEKAEKDVEKWGYIFLGILVAGLIYVAIKFLTGGQVTSYLTFIISDALLLLWIAILVISFHIFNVKSKNYEKKEKDYDELKEDIIDRSSDIWNSNELEELRLEKYQELAEKHDINLYHK
ncbi:DUF2663 family protein [Evansella tamaricis]|uniref:YpbF family protein n=1 Tax=Evansella tamaricis TaxID=2069301 RepID=A0ABS6JPF1_9BACI|nr:DUF2663 family protein [Evansella tamaricis]MBU9714275.1 YpbF family protein [Evansella tamaricis]